MAFWLGPALALITLLVFWPAGNLGFINLDDYGVNGYVVDNPHVHSGVTPASLKWALFSAHAANWHPLTWVSHTVDYQWFGAEPAGHHWMNVLWHAANAWLLFALLRRMTGQIEFAFLVAILFAVHPLRVESVAWVSERKDVLSGFFFLLTLLAWTAHAKAVAGKTGVAIWRSRYYWLALAFFALGLMSKPMLVSVPLILLLLDFWPLNRFSPSAPVRKSGWLLAEKIPFGILAAGSCLLTIWAQAQGQAIVATDRLPLLWRLENVPLAYGAYLKSIFWPQNLAVYYPYTHTQASWVGFIATVTGLGFVSWFAWRGRSIRPWLFVGWIWFIVMMLPVIGLVQVGLQATADRYTYLPAIGIAMIAGKVLLLLAARSQTARRLTLTGTVVGIVILILTTRQQISYWKDSPALFRHALEVNGGDNTSRNYLANAYRIAGDLAGATEQYRAILKTKPDAAEIQYRLAYVLMQQQRLEEAKIEFTRSLQLDPKNANAWACLASVMITQKDFIEAERCFTETYLLRPGDSVIKQLLKKALHENWTETALAEQLRTMSRQTTPESHARAAMIHLAQSQYAAAKTELERARELAPPATDILNHLAWLLATCPEPSLRDSQQAVALAQQAVALADKRPARALTVYGAALASLGRFDEASAVARQAAAAAAWQEEKDLVERNQQLDALFRAGQSFIETN